MAGVAPAAFGVREDAAIAVVYPAADGFPKARGLRELREVGLALLHEGAECLGGFRRTEPFAE